MKIKFGAMVVAGSGKLGGHVFAKNRGGNYIRTKVTPSNPQSITQQENRANLGALSSQWSSLTEEQRRSWNGATGLFERTDQFGDVRQLSGKNLFTSLNRELNVIGEDAILEAPTPQEIPIGIVREAEYQLQGAQENLFGITGSFVANQVYVVVATPPVSAGTNNVKNRLRVIGTAIAITASELGNPEEVAEQYEARFGVPAEGAKIGIGAYPVNEVGQRGVTSTSFAFAVEI